MTKCMNCHRDLAVDSTFCNHCGAKQPSPAGGPERQRGRKDRSQSTVPVALPAVPLAEAQQVIEAPTMHVGMGAPIPVKEKPIWEGRSALAYYVIGIIWSFAWLLLWVALATLPIQSLAKPLVSQSPDLREPVGRFIKEAGPGIQPARYVSWFFAALCLWGILKKILLYLNTYYVFTTQRIKIRTGVISRSLVQVELFRLKDFAVRESLLGRLAHYAHIRIISSDRIVSAAVLKAVPNGVSTTETMRDAAQEARSRTGMITIPE